MTEDVDAFIQSDLRPAETICEFSIVLSGKKTLALKKKIHMQRSLLGIK